MRISLILTPNSKSMNPRMNYVWLLVIACILTGPALAQKNTAFKYTIQKKAESRNGAVVSAHPMATKAGLDILKLGGNAVDAAIATQLALAVVYPGAGNLGGGGFMVARLQNGEVVSLDYREKAPGSASRDMYLDEKGRALTEKSQNGHLSAGVPGTVAGLFASMKYAKLPFSKLIQPAIDLAEKGFVITEGEARGLNANREEFVKYNTVQPVFVKREAWKAGDTLVQKDLANTLKRIRDKGRKGFYEGKTAELIVAEMKRGSGIISLEDLRTYEAKWRKPTRFTYKGHTVITMPLPSSGGVLLTQMLKMVEKEPLKQYGFHSLQSVQLMTEVERRAYADRAKYLGDADFFKVPLKELTSEAYLKERMKDYVPDKAGNSKDVQPGTIPTESEETTHLSVYDKNGNAVAVTTTLNGGYGSKTVVGGAGFLLNNEMDDFSIKPGVPNMYGAVGGEANAIAPGKRMLSSMTPTLVLKNNKPYLVVGTPGGTTIPTSVFQTLVNIIDFELSVEEAVNNPKFHHQWLPDELFIEADFPAGVADRLKQIGYTVKQRGQIGRTEVIKIYPNGKIEAVADKRGDDDARGW
jgi:gamma-glutamyltranspeptidase / glutathione hydrolase